MSSFYKSGDDSEREQQFAGMFPADETPLDEETMKMRLAELMEWARREDNRALWIARCN